MCLALKRDRDLRPLPCHMPVMPPYIVTVRLCTFVYQLTAMIHIYILQ